MQTSNKTTHDPTRLNLSKESLLHFLIDVLRENCSKVSSTSDGRVSLDSEARILLDLSPRETTRKPFVSYRDSPTYQRDATLYIIIVLLFYSITIVTLMIKYMRKEEIDAKDAQYTMDVLQNSRRLAKQQEKLETAAKLVLRLHRSGANATSIGLKALGLARPSPTTASTLHGATLPTIAPKINIESAAVEAASASNFRCYARALLRFETDSPTGSEPSTNHRPITPKNSFSQTAASKQSEIVEPADQTAQHYESIISKFQFQAMTPKGSSSGSMASLDFIAATPPSSAYSSFADDTPTASTVGAKAHSQSSVNTAMRCISKESSIDSRTKRRVVFKLSGGGKKNIDKQAHQKKHEH